MIEAIVASLLNKYLGKYIRDLDSENVNVGIFSGKVELEDLRLRPEALVEFDLPVEVKAGNVGKVILEIPWMNLYSQPVIVVLEDILLLAGPICERPYNEDQERQLHRAAKQRKLEQLESSDSLSIGTEDDEINRGFVEKLTATIVNNLQIFIRNVHFRYEDTISNPNSPLACGLAIHSLSAETTNSKWKPSQIDSSSSSIYKLIKLESMSVYWNPFCSNASLTGNELSNNWKNLMKRGLATFSVNDEEFDFIVKPISAKVKIILNKSNEAKVPKLLLDFVLQDIAAQISRQQYLNIMNLLQSFQMMQINQRYRRFHPEIEVNNNASKWWHYAMNAVIEESIRPFAWKRIKEHRERYRAYKNLYMKRLGNPGNAEIKVDLQKLEDKLDLLNIVIAREQARIEFAKVAPECVHKKKPPKSWWKAWFSSTKDECLEATMEILGEHEKNIWSQFTPEDKAKIYEVIGYSEGEKYSEKPKQYIEHKLNFTFANCTLALVNFDKEIIVTTLTQLLLSLETRPAANAYRFSARAESLSIEGSSVENDLVPVITADHVTNGSTLPHVFAVDFEKYPLHINADYSISVHSEAVEIVYHEHAITEVFSFLQLPATTFEDVKEIASNKLGKIVEVSRAAVEYAIETHKKININVDVKSPYVIVPEYGSLQKGGNLLVLDMGHLIMKTDLQTDTRLLEDATRTELEERLYDRFHLTMAEMQVLFADSGDEWRTAKTRSESESHLFPKFSLQIIFSNSVKPDYRQLPRYKINISVPTMKLNLSDRRVRLLSEFAFNLPLPKPKIYSLSEVDGNCLASVSYEAHKMILAEVIVEPTVLELQSVRNIIRTNNESKETELKDVSPIDSVKPDIEKYYSTSDHSDEEPEQWARMVDLPGFDDNISPSNAIVTLLRFLIGEIVIQLARSSDHVDKPYLMFRIDKLCTDIALMECGPAMQASLGGIQLVDKLHTGTSGEYLELISSRSSNDVITVLYRKVRSDCPDFKTYFHSVEQSVVIDFTSIHLTFHRGAFLTLSKFLEYISQRIGGRASQLKSSVALHAPSTQSLLAGEQDPPVPPGATKFSISARLDEIKMKLCDSDLDFVGIKVAGVEADFILKANEKMILRAQLTNLYIEDLSEMTLYTKILTIEDDKMFDFKYVRHSNNHHKQQDIDNNSRNVNGDGNLRLRIGKIHLTFLYKFLTNLQKFLDPFIHPHVRTNIIKSAEKEVHRQVEEIKTQGMKIHISVDIHIPTILIPQKSDSPNVLVLSLGDLSVENFFHEVTLSNGDTKHIIDNILIRLNSVKINRGVIVLGSSLEIQDPILEPIKLRLDFKRAVAPFHRDILLYEIQGSLDVVKMNVGQKDVSLLIGILKENLAEGHFIETHPSSHPTTPLEVLTPTTLGDDSNVKKLQAFFNSSNNMYKEVNVAFTLEGLILTLYSDGEDLLSSPTHNSSNQLSKFEVDEVSLSLEMFNDKSMKFKCALQAMTLEDIRSDPHLAVKKIFQSYSGDSKVDMGMISVSMPPMIDITYRRNPTGDVEMDILIEKTRLNVSIPYVLAIMRFLYDALPSEKPPDGGIINLGFSGELIGHQNREIVGPSIKCKRQTSLSESTSGYHSTSSAVEELPALAVTAKLKKPEIVLFADPNDKHSRVLVLKTDVFFDYNRNMGEDKILASVIGLQILSCVYGRRRQTAYMVLQPCDAEFSQTAKICDDEINSKLLLTPVDLRLSASTIHTVTDIMGELMSNLKSDEEELIKANKQTDHEDLWGPKKIMPHTWPKIPDQESYVRPTYPHEKPHEILLINIPSIQVTCELENLIDRIPVVLLKTSLEADVNDWSKKIFIKAEFHLEISYFNEKLNTWEPLLEPVMQSENVYRPWEVLIKIFRERSHPIACHNVDEELYAADAVCGELRSVKSHGFSESESSGNDTESENGMTIIKKSTSNHTRRLYAQKSYDSGSLVGCPIDSDSENEEGILDKIADAFGHMFSRIPHLNNKHDVLRESSEGDPSESEEEIGTDIKSDAEDETDTADPEVSGASGEEERPVFLRKEKGADTDGEDSVDSGVEDSSENYATYIIIDAHDKLELTFTPVIMNLIKNIAESFLYKPPQLHHHIYRNRDPSVELHNKIGPQATLSIIEKSESGKTEEDKIIQTASVEDNNEPPLSPASTALLVDISPPDSDVELESEEVDRFSISSALVQVGNADINIDALNYEEDDIATMYHKTTQKRINILIDGFDQLQCLLPDIESTHLYPLHPLKNDTRYHVVVDVAVRYKKKDITVRSPLQIHNHTNHPMNIFYKKKNLEGLQLPHPVQPKNPFEENICLEMLDPDEIYSIPLYVAYHCKIYVQPAYMNYAISNSGIWWQEISAGQNHSCSIHCPANDETHSSFHVKILCQEVSTFKLPSTGNRLIPNYVLHMYPLLVIHNLLPYEVELKFENYVQEEKLDPGNKCAIYNVDLNKKEQMKIEVSTYMGIPWNGSLELSLDIDDNKSITMLTDYDTEGGNKQLGLNAHVERECNLELYLYAPYWIVNKTGLPLQFRGTNSDMVYESQTTEEPLLFRFKRHRRKKVKVRVYNSRWSSSFSLDTVGGSGVVICNDKERNKKYQFLLSTSLSKLHLTKIVTILPYFIVINKTTRYLRYMEENDKADLWFDIAPQQCCAFWPDTDTRKMYVKYRESSKVSQHFPYGYEHTAVLRMDKGTGLCVDVHGGTDSPMIINFYPYTHGEAPVRIDNMCEDIFLKIYQKSLGQVMLLSPYQSLLYTWDDPTLERTLFWNVYNRSKPGIPVFFNKDGYGQEKVSFQTLKPSSNTVQVTSGIQSSSDDDDSENGQLSNCPVSQKTRKDKVVVYWVSYLHGYQRTILFTQDEKLAKLAMKYIDSEKSTMECFLSLHNLGISIVNGLYEEVTYLSLSSSPPIWEVEINGRWKLLTVELSTWLEDKWRADQSYAHLKDYVQVNFAKMQMTKPFFGQLRRHFYPAVWLQYRQSQHQSYLHFRIHRFQVDNQLNDAIFPVVFYPSPIPSYMIKRTGPKPFIEFALFQRFTPELNLTTIKYLKILIQEFNLKLDKGFLLSVYDVYSSLYLPINEDIGLKTDFTTIHSAFKPSDGKSLPRAQQTVYEYINLCPIKMNFSFSPRGIVHKVNSDSKSWQKDVLNFFLNSVGANLTEVKNIELKLACFERKGIKLNPSLLLNDVQSHFKIQIIQQMYVLVLGLDLLGNPYGLVKDFTQGFGDFFYEPFLGSVKGPEEYAEAISTGARSLLGHVVGSTAGSVSLITGSLGQTLAVLSFDEDYRRKRRLRIQAPKTLPDTMVIAGKTFVMGVVLGISGIFTKPITGTQLEGIEGFFKGIGKGLLGLLTKPTGGVIDMVSMAFDGIRRIAEMGEDVVMQNRLPRYLNPCQGIRPYSPYMATGSRLLVFLSRGHYADSDIYFAHAALSKEDRADVTLVTDRHIFLLEKCRFWGGWDIEWVVRIDDVMSVPEIVGDNLVIKVKQDETFNMYSGNDRYIKSEDPLVLKWLQDKIEKVLLFNMIDKPCPLNY